MVHCFVGKCTNNTKKGGIPYFPLQRKGLRTIEGNCGFMLVEKRELNHINGQGYVISTLLIKKSV